MSIDDFGVTPTNDFGVYERAFRAAAGAMMRVKEETGNDAAEMAFERLLSVAPGTVSGGDKALGNTDAIDRAIRDWRAQRYAPR